MLDVGWPELLVIAIVLIVVVGPKDLPPMLRAFGKMTGRLRTMAGEFRQQFDDALKEADMDDVRKTISDAQRLNPVNSLKDAINPLRQMGADIRNDLQKSVKSEAPKVETPLTVPEPAMKLPDEPPVVPIAEKPVEAAVAAEISPAKPARKPRAVKPVKTEEAAPVAKPKPAPRKSVAAAAEQPAAAQPEKKAAARKPSAPKKIAEAEKPAAPKKTASKPKKTSDA